MNSTQTAYLALIERNDPEIPLSLQDKLLGMSHFRLYSQLVALSVAEIVLKHRIDYISTAYPFYGSQRITEYCRRGSESAAKRYGNICAR